MESFEELDELFAILENPIRRRLIRRLSEAPNFALQLSKDLRLAQQLVAKHLQIMENQGLVRSTKSPSPRGPSRKLYRLNKHLSINIDVAPNLFNQQVTRFDKIQPLPEQKVTLSEVEEKISKFFQKERTQQKWSEISSILTDIDQELSRISLERTGFLNIRNRLLHHVSQSLSKLSNMERIVFLRTLFKPNTSVRIIARQLNVPLDFINQIISKLKSGGYLV